MLRKSLKSKSDTDVIVNHPHVTTHVGSQANIGLRHKCGTDNSRHRSCHRHGSDIFQRLSDAIRYIMKEKGYLVTNYIDDIIGQATPSQVQKSFV